MTEIRAKDKLFLAVVVPAALLAAYWYCWRASAGRQLDELQSRQSQLVTAEDFPMEKRRAERELAEAKAFLRELSGQTHTVFTGVAYVGHGNAQSRLAAAVPNGFAPAIACERSHVTFRPLSDAAIDEYVARVRPLDRAGAYDIDESGDLIVASYSGEYENIMGLPVEPLRRFGII